MATGITTLVLDIAANEAVAAASKILAPIGKIAHSVNDAQSEQGNVVKVPVFASIEAAEFGTNNNYTSATDAGVSGVSVELNKHPWASKRLLPDDDMETAAGKDWAAQVAVKAVEACALSLATEAKTEILKGSGTITVTGSTTKQKIASILKSVVTSGFKPADGTLILAPALYAEVVTELDAAIYGSADGIKNGYVDGLAGFARVAMMDLGAEHTCAFVQSTALAVATRIPKVENSDLFDVSTVTSPELGPWAFQLRSTGTNNVDAKFLGAEIIYGVKILKANEILLG